MSSVCRNFFCIQPPVLCKPVCFDLQGCWMTASPTCDTDLCFALLNYWKKLFDNPMINVHILWICKDASVTCHHMKTHPLYYTSLLLCSSSVWIQCNIYDSISFFLHGSSFIYFFYFFFLTTEYPCAFSSSLPKLHDDTLLLFLH